MDADLARLYDDLARYQWWRRKLSRAAPGEGLAMHKRLAAPRAGEDGPPAGAEGLDLWLWERLEPAGDVRVLDVGCGFGATLSHWAERAPAASLVGLTLSEYQARRAGETARALGFDGRCEFRCQSFDAPVEGTFDLVVSIESLFHARDLRVTLANLGPSVAPGGRLLLVEDMPLVTGLEDDASGSELLRRWSTECFHGAEDYRGALGETGLEVQYELDLSAQVPRVSTQALGRRRRRLALARHVAPGRSARTILDAFLGGVALQELYARHRMAYRVMVARRGAA